jgi:opacity protein-like surface antigen
VIHSDDGAGPRCFRFGNLHPLATVWAVLLALAIGGAPAPGQVTLGAQGSWASDTRLGIGARGDVGLDFVLRGLELTAYGDRYFPGSSYGADVSAWEGGLNLVYRLAAPSARLVPYAGVGISYSRFRASVRLVDSEVSGRESLGGVNALAGLRFSAGGLTPFIEGRFTSSDQSQAIVSAGVRIWSLPTSPLRGGEGGGT